MTDQPPALPTSGKHTPLVAAWFRGAAFFGLWLVLMPSSKPADLAIGVFAALAATGVSLALLPPATGHVRFVALLKIVPHFLWQSVVGAVDVARRAFDPRMPLRPGFVSYRVGFPPGLARNEFATFTSLLPGSLPVGDDDGALVYHCLDITQPVAEQMLVEERLLAGAFVAGERHA